MECFIILNVKRVDVKFNKMSNIYSKLVDYFGTYGDIIEIKFGIK